LSDLSKPALLTDWLWFALAVFAFSVIVFYLYFALINEQLLRGRFEYDVLRSYVFYVKLSQRWSLHMHFTVHPMKCVVQITAKSISLNSGCVHPMLSN
jgi:hypothetical protein